MSEIDQILTNAQKAGEREVMMRRLVEELPSLEMRLAACNQAIKDLRALDWFVVGTVRLVMPSEFIEHASAMNNCLFMQKGALHHQIEAATAEIAALKAQEDEYAKA